MELRTYFLTLRRRWFVVLAFVALAVLGVFIYHRVTSLVTAQATVAVLDPVAARPGARLEAQVTFDQIVKSHRVAVQVAERMGEKADLVGRRIAVSVVSSSSGSTAVSPLYAVRGQAKGASSAKRLVSATVEEARILYLEINFANSAEVRQALAQEVARVEELLKKARDDFNTYTVAHNVVGLPQRIQKQLDVVTALQLQVRQSPSSQLRAALADEQQELDRLSALQPQYKQLEFNLQRAEGRAAQLDQNEEGVVVSQQLPSRSQVKLLDSPGIQSPLTWLLLTYSLGVVLALLLGFSVVYLMAVFAKLPETAEGVGEAFGAAVLARIPQASTRGK